MKKWGVCLRCVCACVCVDVCTCTSAVPFCFNSSIPLFDEAVCNTYFANIMLYWKIKLNRIFICYCSFYFIDVKVNIMLYHKGIFVSYYCSLFIYIVFFILNLLDEIFFNMLKMNAYLEYNHHLGWRNAFFFLIKLKQKTIWCQKL